MKKPEKKSEKKSGAQHQRPEKKKGTINLTKSDKSEYRRGQVIELLGHGVSVTEVAKRLGVSRETIYQDLHAIGLEEKDKLNDNANYLARLSIETQALKKEVWGIYNNECHYINKQGKKKTVPIMRLGAIKELREIIRNQADVMIKLGALIAAPEKTEGKFVVMWGEDKLPIAAPKQAQSGQIQRVPICAKCGTDRVSALDITGITNQNWKCLACGNVGIPELVYHTCPLCGVAVTNAQVSHTVAPTNQKSHMKCQKCGEWFDEIDYKVHEKVCTEKK